MSDGGKGYDRRPQQVSEAEAEANWNRIFNKKGLNSPIYTTHSNHLLKDDEMGFNTPLINHIGNDE
jgi:hypothetical protein